MKTILSVVGARPQFIKASLVSREIANSPELQEVLVHTGQHYDSNMSEVFFQELGIPEPAYNLGISQGNHGEMTGRMMCELERVILQTKPDMVLIYGDTNSTLAGALVGVKLHIPVAHVEGGLRTHRLKSPEEVNRVLTDRISSLIFYPTDLALDNLKKEGFEGGTSRLIRTGDLMYDAALFFRPPSGPASDEDFILLTLHRAENTGPQPLREIVRALNTLAEHYRMVFPVHPRTRKALNRDGLELHSNIEQREPVSYGQMLQLLNDCHRVITDSGGLQKEAHAYGKTSLVLMDYTPWAELEKTGYLCCTEAKTAAILENWKRVLRLQPQDVSLYGDGRSAATIVRSIESYLDEQCPGEPPRSE